LAEANVADHGLKRQREFGGGSSDGLRMIIRQFSAIRIDIGNLMPKFPLCVLEIDIVHPANRMTWCDRRRLSMPKWFLIVCILGTIATVIRIALAHARESQRRHEDCP
jgi:hypothetical protein